MDVSQIQSKIHGLGATKCDGIHSLLTTFMVYLMKQHETITPGVATVAAGARGRGHGSLTQSISQHGRQTQLAQTNHLSSSQPTRPPFKTYMRSDVGFPTQVIGPSSRTRSQRGGTSLFRASSFSIIELPSDDVGLGLYIMPLFNLLIIVKFIFMIICILLLLYLGALF